MEYFNTHIVLVYNELCSSYLQMNNTIKMVLLNVY